MTTLDDIVSYKREELVRTRAAMSLADLETMSAALPPPLDFATALRGPGLSLIAEVKKASPSAGVLRPDMEPAEVAGVYAKGGASAISVLTESRFFLGDIAFLRSIRVERESWRNRPPLLRKDFIVDAYQVCEARAYGADALLLIVAVLDPRQLASLLELTWRLGMEALVETHTAEETAIAVDSGARVIGINNRDLRTFKVDLETTAKLRGLIPRDRLVVSESGIKNAEDIRRLREWEVDAMLIGEALVTAKDIRAKMREFLDQG